MSNVFAVRNFLLNAGSPNMVVNGSVTPVVFTMSIASGKIFSADELILTMSGSGNINDPAQFWTFAALTNGISTEQSLGGISLTQTGIIKSNIDLISFVGADFIGKTLGTHNIVRGTIQFKTPISFNGTRGDYFRITIRDNLTSGGVIETMNICLRGTQVTI